LRSVLGSAVSLAADLTRFRDADTGAHLDRVTRYARLIAEALGLEADFIEEFAALAPAHDVGKLAIPGHILLKQGTLLPSELEVMRGHVASGMAVVEELIRDFDLAGSAQVSMLRNIVRSHHEALDGSGYPDGLKADEIPLEARIIAVADVFDALTTERPYKRTWTSDAALGFLSDQRGTRFDEACVAALERSAPEVESIRLRG
jgi:HD-GYP domain-containing protein (c-di-GMP phosphodiesterase class II)